MQKIFVNADQFHNENIIITDENYNHLVHVLRMKEGEQVLVGNLSSNQTYLSEIKEIHEDYANLVILEEYLDTSEPKTYIHLFQGLPKADKMEQIIQKGTEIGISEFTPLIVSRCIAKIEEKNQTKKMERWQKIAESAAKQCKRNHIPKINFSKNLKNIYPILKEYDIVLIAYEEEKDFSLKQAIKMFQQKQKENIKIAILIGPEGGFSREEVEKMQEANAISVSLGKRILRTETASLVVSAILLYELED